MCYILHRFLSGDEVILDEDFAGSNNVALLSVNDTTTRKVFKFTRPLNAVDSTDIDVMGPRDLYFTIYDSNTREQVDSYVAMTEFDGK